MDLVSLILWPFERWARFVFDRICPEEPFDYESRTTPICTITAADIIAGTITADGLAARKVDAVMARHGKPDA